LLCRAKPLGIKTDIKLKASPFGISEFDICSLLNNIADNALEVCAKLPEDRERLINLSITRHEPYLIFLCKNGNPGTVSTENEKIITSKIQSGHGYGLKVIERIADSYDGMMNVDYNEDTFTIKVALKDEKR